VALRLGLLANDSRGHINDPGQTREWSAVFMKENEVAVKKVLAEFESQVVSAKSADYKGFRY
jgi:hypothetical protein